LLFQFPDDGGQAAPLGVKLVTGAEAVNTFVHRPPIVEIEHDHVHVELELERFIFPLVVVEA